MNKKNVFSKIWFLALLLVTFVAGCASNGPEIPIIPPDTIAPTVSFTSPASGDLAVPYDRKVSVAFSEAMDPATITTTTYTLTGPGLATVSGTVATVGPSSVFTPAAPLAYSTTYTATIKAGVKDLAGNALASNYAWSFTTGAVPDTIAPIVSFTAPLNNQTAVPNNRIIHAAFSEVMDPSTITTASFSMTGPGLIPFTIVNVPGAVSSIGTSATFTPSNPLSADSTYTATITTGARDLAGNALASNFVWSFKTGPVADIIRPTVSFTSPIQNSVTVDTNRKVNAAFSEAMDPATITTVSFSVKNTNTGANVPGTVVPFATSATFTPSAILANSTNYTATITTGVKDLAGNNMLNNYVLTFKTSAAADTVRPTVSVTSPANTSPAVPVNRKVGIAFSEVMDATTITTGTVSMKATVSGVNVPGTVTAVNTSANFTPTNNLATGTNYSVTVTNGVEDLAGNAMAGNYVFTFTTATAVPTDVIPPTVTVTSPTNTAVAVPVNRKVTVGFSEAMDPLTITALTFVLTSPTGTVVPATVSAINTAATLIPSSNLEANTKYTGTITNSVEDLAGNSMATNYIFSFTTAVTLDTTRPTVIETINKNGDINVPTNTKVGAKFSEVMNPLTITSSSFTLTKKATPLTLIIGSVTYSGVNAVFSPTNILDANTEYTATITTVAEDLAGNTLLNNYVWSWTTAAAADTTRPLVVMTAPLDGATGVAINSAVNATFSKSMDPLTINTASFKVAGITGVVTYNVTTKIATLTPSADLATGTTYTATVTTAAADIAGNTLFEDKVWSFTTAIVPVVVPPVVNILKSAATYGTFGGTAGMTNMGTLTQIHGDIGTTATTTSTVTGFHDTKGDIYTETGSNKGAVNGTIFTCTNSVTGPNSTGVNAANCAAATQARLDAQTAYLELQAKPSNGVLAANLAGTTINPGVYTTSSSVRIEGGDLTLDALGDANAIFVFQIGSTLTVGGPGAAFPQSIILAGGAQSKNIFWQVGTAATINAGGGGTMEGTIIAMSGVSFSTSGNVAIVMLNGRALSLISSVTMVNTVINVPAD